MGSNLICFWIGIVMLLLGIYGGIDLAREKRTNFTARGFIGKREIVFEGNRAVFERITQNIFCLYILLGIIALNRRLPQQIAYVLFAIVAIIFIARVRAGSA